jgi:hypothetical protein
LTVNNIEKTFDSKKLALSTTNVLFQISLKVKREYFLNPSIEKIDEWDASCLYNYSTSNYKNNTNQGDRNNNNKEERTTNKKENSSSKSKHNFDNNDGDNYTLEAATNKDLERAVGCLKKLTEDIENGIGCYELLSEWNPILDWCKFWVEGVAVSVIGVFGLWGNTLAIVALGNNKVVNK